MPDAFTMELFSEQVGTTFHMHYGQSQTADLELVSVRDLGSGPNRTQFSLIFLGPNTCPVAQHTYELAHDALGTLQIFLVPVAKSDKGLEYEAVFNLPKN